MRLLRFGFVSGMGLTTDVLVYVLLYRGGVPPGFANLISAGLAVSLVFLVSQRRVFRYGGHFLLPLFAAYVVYQVVAVSAASAGVGALVAQAAMSPLLAKAVVTPVTFGCNYVFMSILFRGGSPAPVAVVPGPDPEQTECRK